MLPPGIRQDDEPPLYRLDEYTFQKLCRDVFEKEPEIGICNVYGTRGQTQDGIDLLAYRRNGDGIEVGQCKCYEDFPPEKIREASKDFLDYWDVRWSKENVKRFILFVACDLSTRQRQDELNKQRVHFAALGITYEPWSVATITNRLRLHRGIVATYLRPPEYWVRVICGEEFPKLPVAADSNENTTTLISTAVLNQVDRLVTKATGEIEQRLEYMRSIWREGREDEVVQWIDDVKSNTDLWPFMAPEIKAKVLRFEAGIELDRRNDTTRAKQLADEALSLSPSDNQARLRAMFSLRDGDPERALQILATEEDEDSLNMRAAILLDIGKVAESLELLIIEDDDLESNG
jgi:hypothetical protein